LVKKVNLFINRKPVQGPWGGGNLFVKAFYDEMRRLGHRVSEHLSDELDVLFVQDPRPAHDQINLDSILSYKNATPNVRIVHRVNECDARKGTTGVDNFLRECSKHTDHTVFVSEWMREYHLARGWHCRSHSVLYNGVNLGHFSPQKKLNNGKINIVTHHWSDNPLKGADVYSFLDELVGRDSSFSFTYIGRTKQKFKNTHVVEPLSGKDLGDCLGKYDVYVSGSRFDPGPNHIIESLACGLPTFAFVDGGGACEFAGSRHVFYDQNSLLHCLRNYQEIGKNDSKLPVSWGDCMQNLDKTLREL
jgi:glycosyltransferase involved in cell wall biosynthesis